MAKSEAGRRLMRYIAANVRARRRALGLTQAQLSERVGLEIRQLQNIESAHSAPSYDALASLAEALETSAHDLLREAEFVPPPRGRPSKEPEEDNVEDQDGREDD